MKRIILFLTLCFYYLLGNIIFNIIFSITEVIIVNNLGMKINFFDICTNNFLNSLSIYTILYIGIIIGVYLYNWISVKKLNEKLEILKRREKDEK